LRIIEPMSAMQNIDEGVKIERVIGRTDSGKTATAPGLPHVKMIDPNGHVVWLPVRSTRNLREAAKAGVDTIGYEAFILRKKRRKNWLVYDEVPEHPFHDVPNPEAGKPGPDGMPQPATIKVNNREFIISERKAYMRAQSEPYRRAWERHDETQALQSKAAMSEALADYMTEVKRLAAADRKKSGG
jgi:hypothetical protein